MTIMAAEAVGGSEAAGGAAAAGRGLRPSRGSAPRQRPTVAPVRRGLRPSQETPEGPRPSRPAAPGGARRRPAAARKIGRTNYQPVILVEFIAAILLTAATPIATKKDTQGLSPYAGADIIKLSAITLVYLLLAMISVGGRSWGRVAAWLGGLILLTDGLYEASNITRDLQIFGGGGGEPSPPKPSPLPPGAITGTTQAPGTTTAGGRG